METTGTEMAGDIHTVDMEATEIMEVITTIAIIPIILAEEAPQTQ